MAFRPGRLSSVLFERERLGSTGFGAGIAIPHAKIEGMDRVVGVFVQMAKPIDFKAVDSMPCRSVLLPLFAS